MISAPESVVGIAATRAPAHRGHGLRDVDDTAPAQGDERASADVVDETGGELVHRAAVDLVDGAGEAREVERHRGERPRRRQELPVLPALRSEDLPGLGERTRAEDDDPIAVAPGELALNLQQEPAARIRTGTLRLTRQCSTS